MMYEIDCKKADTDRKRDTGLWHRDAYGIERFRQEVRIFEHRDDTYIKDKSDDQRGF